MSSEIQLVPKDCHNYDVFRTQGRCPLVDVCNEDCMFVWKKCYEDLNSSTCKSVDIEDLRDEIEYLQNEVSSLESDNDELYWKKDDIENQYKEIITDLANYLDNESFEKLRKLNLESKVSDWFDDLDLERSYIKTKEEDNVIDV